jgi:hypothetical protein
MKQKKINFSRFFLLLPILFFLTIIITSEKNLYYIDGADLNFDLLIFLGKGFFSDPFEPSLLTPNRAYTSLAGNIYQLFFNLPSNLSGLLLIYRISNILPFLFFIFYLIKKNDNQINLFFFIIL